MSINGVAENITNQIVEVTHDQLVQELQQSIRNSPVSLDKIEIKINELLNAAERYEHIKDKGSITSTEQALTYQKDIIYLKFFELQNLINEYNAQRIVMTYVHVDEFGERSIRISDNDIEHIQITEGRNFKKLSYVMDEHYRTLKNSLPEQDNAILSNTAKEVEYRYNTYKKRVLWYFKGWQGYQFRTRGPINEAYVNFYVHNIKLKGTMEANINNFMLNRTYGAITADATRGYMIGDASKDGIQYAVKGQFGSPQGVRQVIKDLKKMLMQGFNQDALDNFIAKYTTQELEKEYKPQIRPLTERTLRNTIRKMGEDIERIIK